VTRPRLLSTLLPAWWSLLHHPNPPANLSLEPAEPAVKVRNPKVFQFPPSKRNIHREHHPKFINDEITYEITPNSKYPPDSKLHPNRENGEIHPFSSPNPPPESFWSSSCCPAVIRALLGVEPANVWKGKTSENHELSKECGEKEQLLTLDQKSTKN